MEKPRLKRGLWRWAVGPDDRKCYVPMPMVARSWMTHEVVGLSMEIPLGSRLVLSDDQKYSSVASWVLTYKLVGLSTEISLGKWVVWSHDQKYSTSWT